MGKFHKRSDSLELMDLPIADASAIEQNFRELVMINKYLGGAEHSHAALEAVMRGELNYSLVDIGSGAGDFLAYLHKLDGATPDLHGIDPMPEAVQFALNNYANVPNAHWHQRSYQDWFADDRRTDIVHAALFCHHLGRGELVAFLKSAVKAANKAVIINDLHRHPLAYYSIKLICTLFSKSVYTKNDAPLSVLRGFTRSEWEEMMEEAGIASYRIKWKWAFRHIIVIETQERHEPAV